VVSFFALAGDIKDNAASFFARHNRLEQQQLNSIDTV
jgi:hypothetical protein